MNKLIECLNNAFIGEINNLNEKNDELNTRLNKMEQIEPQLISFNSHYDLNMTPQQGCKKTLFQI
jgi:hypothetical protein